MNLINFGVDVKLDEILENEVKLEFIGDLKGLPKNAQQGVEKCIEATKHFDDFTLTVALNYGGISDILNAFKELQNNGLELNEENFLAKTQLGNNDLDIFIRTGGDMRLSNFLLPNIGYSELFFTDKLWPEFTANDFEDVLKDFDERNRRFGK
jgi:undecaprenyl diphosphate synthase